MRHPAWSKSVSSVLLLLALGTAESLFAAGKLALKFRAYQGGTAAPAGPITFERALSAHLSTTGEAADETAAIRKVFHLSAIRLAIEADLIIGEGGQAPDRVRQTFSIGGKDLQIILLATEFAPPLRLFVVVLEKAGEGFRNILGETIEMRGGGASVLGLSDGSGNPAYLTLRVVGPPEMVPPPPLAPPPPPPRIGEDEEGFAEFARGAVDIGLDRQPPILLKMTEPSLPAEGRLPAAGAHVSLYVRIDEQGRVIGVHRIHASDMFLEEPAKAAVRQWRYEPYLIEGKPVQVILPVTVRFPGR